MPRRPPKPTRPDQEYFGRRSLSLAFRQPPPPRERPAPPRAPTKPAPPADSPIAHDENESADPLPKRPRLADLPDYQEGLPSAAQSSDRASLNPHPPVDLLAQDHSESSENPSRFPRATTPWRRERLRDQKAQWAIPCTESFQSPTPSLLASNHLGQSFPTKEVYPKKPESHLTRLDVSRSD